MKEEKTEHSNNNFAEVSKNLVLTKLFLDLYDRYRSENIFVRTKSK